MKTARPKKKLILKTILKKILLLILILIVAYNLIYFVCSLFHIKGSFLGRNFFVTNSNAMEPTISEKDLVITKKVKADNIKKDDVVLYTRSGEERLARIMYIRENKGVTSYLIKGDNNRYLQEILASDVKAKVIDTISGGKIFITMFRSKISTFFIITYAILLARYKQRIKLKNQQRKNLRQRPQI